MPTLAYDYLAKMTYLGLTVERPETLSPLKLVSVSDIHQYKIKA